jgi:hypothetical protein
MPTNAGMTNKDPKPPSQAPNKPTAQDKIRKMKPIATKIHEAVVILSRQLLRFHSTLFIYHFFWDSDTETALLSFQVNFNLSFAISQ